MISLQGGLNDQHNGIATLATAVLRVWWLGDLPVGLNMEAPGMAGGVTLA